MGLKKDVYYWLVEGSDLYEQWLDRCEVAQSQVLFGDWMKFWVLER